MASSSDSMGCFTVTGWILGLFVLWAAVFGIVCNGTNHSLNCSQNGVEMRHRSIQQDEITPLTFPVSTATKQSKPKRK